MYPVLLKQACAFQLWTEEPYSFLFAWAVCPELYILRQATPASNMANLLRARGVHICLSITEPRITSDFLSATNGLCKPLSKLPYWNFHSPKFSCKYNLRHFPASCWWYLLHPFWWKRTIWLCRECLELNSLFLKSLKCKVRNGNSSEVITCSWVW